MKFCILTLGCKVNSYESEFIKEKFIKEGGIETPVSEAEVIVINTCSVTNQSDKKSRQIIRMAKRENPNATIVACGCSIQNHQEKLNDLGIDIMIGNKDKSTLVELVKEYRKKDKQPISRFYDMQSCTFEDMMLESEKDKTRAFVKIQDGCNNYCAYCIIPYLRGNLRSKDINIAEKEIECLVNTGHHEIVLTGIHTGSYGRGMNYDLTDLIRRISRLDKLERIRISSIEITELDEKFLEELKSNPKLCDHMHIPLQSGSDVVLRKMNRKYDLKYFKNKIAEIRKIRPNMSITTDLIVGFPYETDEEFNKTYDFLKEIEFTKIHTFPFSLRNGTKAEEMSDNFVDEKVKKERVHKVLELSDALEERYYSKFIGQVLDVIIETSNGGESKGHTSNYILVHLDEEVEEGATVSVKIESVDGKYVKGIIL